MQNQSEKRCMVIPTGIEPVTYRLGICRSILLSYGTNRCAFAGDSGIVNAFRHILFFRSVANPAKSGEGGFIQFQAASAVSTNDAK